MARRHEALVPLSHDHQKALALAFRLHHPAPPGPVTLTTPASTLGSRREETLSFFHNHLQPHFAIEEEVLFPVLCAAYPAGTPERALLDTLSEEHGRMIELCDAIAAASANEDLARALTEFADLLEGHVRREERELFAKFPGPLEPATIDGLRRNIHTRRPPDVPGGLKV